jgi:glutamyl-tRNA synthetase
MMHLGNIRSALINALYAARYYGTLILRIEDTDTQRNYDPEAQHIQADLAWLGLTFQEGPGIGGPHEPYFQSQRGALYAAKLQYLIDNGYVYRCFCQENELERKREMQKALKLPPRYDRTCMHLTKDQIEKLCADNRPFVWRFKLDHAQTIIINDLSHGNVTFELKHFSDFPLTRQDGTVTFIFANCVDDIDMAITHIFRGEEHMSNTACQAALYYAFGVPLATYWHLPLLCNANGKKLSKRDFGFSLRDLKDAGFVPEAILNYLAIIGASYPDEIMSFNQLVNTIELEQPTKVGYITYDVEKFRWVNRKWLERYTPEQLYERVLPFLHAAYPTIDSINQKQIEQALQLAKTEMVTLADAVPLLRYSIHAPETTKTDVLACIDETYIPQVLAIMQKTIPTLHTGNFTDAFKSEARAHQIPLKPIFWFIRLALTGKTDGPAIHELITILGISETQKRIERLMDIIRT